MRVSSYARGYLALLQASTGGKTPNDASDVIVPTIDIAPFIGANFRSMMQLNLPAMAANLNGPLTVPEGEFWIVRAGSCQVSHGAGATITDLQLLLFPPEAGGSVAVSAATTLNGAGAENRGVLWEPRDIILVPGSRVFAFATAVVGAVVGDIRLLVDRLQS